MTEVPQELAGIEDILPLSPSQEGMLLQSVSNPGAGYYLGVIVASLPADLDRAAFAGAWQDVIDRHQALRSTLVWETLDSPVQLISETAALAIEDLDWSGKAAEEAEAAFDQLVLDLRGEGLDVSAPPAMRAILVRWPGGHHRFCWLVHHALLDDWSVSVVLKEVEDAYVAAANGRMPRSEEAVTVRTFADWLAGQDPAETESWWTERFSDLDADGRLPFDAPASQGKVGPATRILETTLSEQDSAALSTSLLQNRLTLGSAIAAVWAVVLGRLVDRDEVLFGIATTMRPAEIEGVERAVGNFVTTLPARMNLAATPTLRSLIAERQEAAAASHAHSSLSLTNLKTRLGLSPTEPIFESIVSLKSGVGAGDSGDRGRLFANVQSRLSSGFPLALIVEPGARITVRLIADGKRLDERYLPAVLDMVVAGLTATPRYMDRPPLDLPVLTETSAAVTEPDVGDVTELGTFGLVQEEILARAEERPEATAVAMGERSITYRELTDRASLLASHLLEHGAGSSQRVALLMSRGPDVFVAMLGALLAGSTYVPIDVAYPDDHVSRILDLSGATVVLTDPANAARARAGGRTAIVVGDLAQISPEPASLPPVSPDSAAYLLFTSGSTGTPKGVLVSHRNLSSSTEARVAWYKEMPEVYLLLSSIAFDSSVAGIYWTLCMGGTLVLPEPDDERDPHRIGSLVHRHGVTHTLCLPALYEMILASNDTEALRSLQTVIVAGEAVTQTVLDRHRGSTIAARLVNEYGPTEATVWCSACDLGGVQSRGPIPIGRAIPGSRLMIRDSRNRPVLAGLPGELWVGGAGVALGYHDLPEETARRFVKDPSQAGARAYRTGDRVRRRGDGMFEYLGRIDRQIKLRGYRVEPSWIESVLLALPEVREAAVDVRREGDARSLVAWIVGEPDHAPELARVTQHLKDTLPGWMVPSQLLMIDELPRTANGKTDYRALAASTEPPRQTGILPPESETEKKLAAIWKKVLWLERDIGIDEDFFDLGGHSLAAMRLITEIDAGFGKRLAMAQLGRLTTIQDQAIRIDATLNATGDERTPDRPAEAPPTVPPSDVEDPLGGLTEAEEAKLHAYLTAWPEPIREGSLISVANGNGSLPPLFFWFTARADFERLAAQLGPDQPVYGMRAANGVVRSSDTDRQISSQHRVARHYLRDILAAHPTGTFFLGGHCQGGIIALNVANMLLNLRRSVATVILVQKEPPIPYPGHVDLIIAQQAMTNPYTRFIRPEETWNRLYRSWTVDSLPCGYSNMYWGRNERLLAAKIRDRLENARNRASWPLPPGGHLVAWGAVTAPEAAAQGEVFDVTVTVKNTSNAAWEPTAKSGLYLVSRPVGSARSEIARVGRQTPLERTIGPGDEARLSVSVQMPQETGDVRFELDIVEEGISHFSDRGSPPQVFQVRATPVRPTQARHSEAPSDARPLLGAPAAKPDALADFVTRLKQARTAGNAARGMEVARSESPSFTEALIEQGLCALDVGDHGAAERPLLAAARLAPDDAWAAFAVGRLRQAQGRPVAAAIQMWKARKLAGNAELRTLAEYHLSQLNTPRHKLGELVDAMRKLTRR